MTWKRREARDLRGVVGRVGVEGVRVVADVLLDERAGEIDAGDDAELVFEEDIGELEREVGLELVGLGIGRTRGALQRELVGVELRAG
jgi:hypothetical protein